MQVKVRLFLCSIKYEPRHENGWDSEVIASHILKSRHMMVSSQLHAPVALSFEKDHQYPLDRRLGELQSWSGRGEERKIFASAWRESNPSPQPSHYTDWATPAPLLSSFSCTLKLTDTSQQCLHTSEK
jgi:hypothetical protein